MGMNVSEDCCEECGREMQLECVHCRDAFEDDLLVKLKERNELGRRMAECFRKLFGCFDSEEEVGTDGLMDLLVLGSNVKNGLRLLKQADAIWKKENDDGQNTNDADPGPSDQSGAWGDSG